MDVCTECFEAQIEDGGRCHPVGIVVSIDEDLLVAVDGGEDQLNGFTDSRQFFWGSQSGHFQI